MLPASDGWLLLVEGWVEARKEGKVSRVERPVPPAPIPAGLTRGHHDCFGNDRISNQRSALQPTVMPYAPSALTDSQIAAIAAYLRAIPRRKPARDIALLN